MGYQVFGEIYIAEAIGRSLISATPGCAAVAAQTVGATLGAGLFMWLVPMSRIHAMAPAGTPSR